MKKYYIAYGSNMSVLQMEKRCPDAVLVGTATLKDWELVFRHHATIEPKPGACVPVVVWEISDSDEQNLDHYEGYPGYYRKHYVSAEMKELKSPYRHRIRAMVYIMVEGISRISPPTDPYLKGIEEAYKQFNFNGSILRKAVDESICEYLGANDYIYY